MPEGEPIPAEQRQHERYAAAEDIIYSTMDRGSMMPQRVYHPGRIVNKSQGGMAMRVTMPHKVDETLWLEGVEGHTTACLAAVRWIREVRMGELFEVGVQF